MRERLRSEIRRTGVSPNRILETDGEVRKTIRPSQIYRWLSGETKTADRNHFEACLAFWRPLPDAAPSVAVTPEKLDVLNAEKDRTGVGPKALLASGKSIPVRVNADYLTNLLRGRYEDMPRECYEWLLDAWGCLPDAPKRIELTGELVSELSEAMQQAGSGPFKLLRGTAESRPDGLTGTMIQSWLNGTTKTARQDHLDFVQELLSN